MIHKYQMNGYNIVLDVHSGSVHVVEDVAYHILEHYTEKSLEQIIEILKEKFDENEIKEGYRELEELKENGLLFSEDIYEKVVAEVDERNPVVKALCLLVAHDCNLACTYCFAEEGEYHSRGKRGLMNFEVGQAAIDFLIKNSSKRKNLEVDFFGGEPLMNFDVTKQIVAYAKSIEKKHNKSFRFTITTNGVLLDDDTIAYLNENMNNVVLSIDGRREVNDKMRQCKNKNASSYDLILPKFKKLAESRNQNNYYVRGTFTKHNMDFSQDVLHLADLGFKQVSIEPVVGDDKLDYTFEEEDLEIIFAEYEKLAIEILDLEKNGKGFNFFHFMIDLTGGPCVAKRLVGCGAGTEYLAVTADGELYPCHQFAGIDEFKMGTVFEGVNTPDIRKEFEKCNVYSKDECAKCWAKFYCSGGCASNAYSSNGDIFKPYKIGCELQRKRTECAIMVRVAQNI